MADRQFMNTDDIYDDVSEWTSVDFYGVFRYLSHAFSSAGRSKAYTAWLVEADFTRMAPEIKAIAKCLLAEIPSAATYINRVSLDAILAQEPLNSPIELREKPPYRPRWKPYARMGVMM